MNDQLRESMSALMDGEADALEVRRIVASSDAELRSTWRRYHLMRDAMHQQELSFQGLDVTAAVSEAIAGDRELYSSRRVSAGSRWWRPAAGMAVAASVALVMVFGVRSFESSETTAAVNVAVAPQFTPAQPASITTSKVYPVNGFPSQRAGNVAVSLDYAGPNTGFSNTAGSKATENRLEHYLLKHTERAALNNGQGIITFARVASFETE